MGKIKRTVGMGTAVMVVGASGTAAWLGQPFAEAGEPSGTALPAAALSASAQQAVEKAVRGSNADAFVALHHDRQMYSDGETGELYNLASVRKSLISALYGIAVDRGLINPEATLGQLGIDDKAHPLTATEKTATVRDLLQARSGVYLPSLGESPSMKERRPARGSHDPGTFFYYNNWDFNALGTIFEQQTKLSLGAAFDRWIAKPTGMRRFSPDDVVYQSSQTTEHRMYRFYMSAEDLARFGALYADDGRWQGRQILPAAWAKDTLTRHSPVTYSDTYDGYGYLWWLDSDEQLAWADGSGGQFIAVDPARHLTVVSLNDTGQSPLGVWWYSLDGRPTDQNKVADAVGVLRGTLDSRST